MTLRMPSSPSLSPSFSGMNTIKNDILGTQYDLSFSFISAARMRRLNRIYRDIDKPTDILSFPLSKNEGEMYICKSETRKEAKKFGRTYENFIRFLFIHGCVHLKGFDHSSTMERIERRFQKRFGI
jgi:probable rRNA maturation factor